MGLSKELEIRGLTKLEFSEILGVSRQTLHRMGDEVSEEVAKILAGIPRSTVKPWDLPDDELKEIIRNLAAIPKHEVCEGRGWQVWELSRAIDRWVERNPYKKPENGYDLSRYVKGEVV